MSVWLTVFVIAAILGVVVILTPSVREWLKSLVPPPPPPPSPCGKPTGGALAATTVPGITLTANGKAWPGAANISPLPWFGYSITLTNATAAPATIDGVRLWESIDNKFTPEEELLPQCRYMAISGGDCAPGSLPVTLAPNATGTILVRATRPQTGYLEIRTSLGQLTLPISATA